MKRHFLKGRLLSKFNKKIFHNAIKNCSCFSPSAGYPVRFFVYGRRKPVSVAEKAFFTSCSTRNALLLGCIFFLTGWGRGYSQNQPHPITGIVISAADSSPLKGATVKLKSGKVGVLTGKDGGFTLTTPINKGTLVITFIGYQTQEVDFGPDTQMPITVKLAGDGNELEEVEVSTGYQQIPKERATGSFDFVDTKLINRSVTTNILDRLENLTPGISFRNANDGILIRGRSSINSNVSPLIILDNFPYDGKLENINPNDVSSISVLKDAAAASIWGARAGNGVIVITTKKGRSAKPEVSFTSSTTFVGKPDILHKPVISSADYIDLEKFLFKQGYYDFDELYNQIGFGAPPFTPVVELLIAQRDGFIDSVAAFSQIENYKQNDVRRDLNDYFYQTDINQQYALSVNGRSAVHAYYFSVGWDHNNTNDKGVPGTSRLSLKSSNQFTINSKLQAEANLQFIQYNLKSGNPVTGINSGNGKALYPYADLVDDQGNALILARDNRLSYVDTVGDGKLLDWHYRPYADLHSLEGVGHRRDYVLNGSLTYQILSGLKAMVSYQYESEIYNGTSTQTASSYYTRNLINQLTQRASPDFIRPIPLGGIRSLNATETRSHQGRALISYDQSWHNLHEIHVMGGWEIKDWLNTGDEYQQYGYQRDGSVVATSLEYITEFVHYNNSYVTSRINNYQSVSEKSDRFLSTYANASYTYRNTYTLSGSIRQDAANLFGVDANQRGVPLWSAGLAWNVAREPFYYMDWLPEWKLRATYGRSGNVSRQTSAYTTAEYGTAMLTSLRQATIVNPPNASLRWEQVHMWNVATDFSSLNSRLSGTIEYYWKKSTGLMGEAPIDPTVGLYSQGRGGSVFLGNVASMKGHGVDIQLNATVLKQRFSWQSTFLLSYAQMNISEYLVPVADDGNSYINANNTVTPLVGKPIYTVFGYRWAGLDPQDGSPQGYLDGEVSKDYAAIMSNTPLDSMMYAGPAQPPYFGAFRNTFSYKNLSFSFNISYKSGYAFRRNSISYGQLFSSWTGHSDYALRWQKPGDEKWTNVPAMVYPADDQSEAFYGSSETLVIRGDHIRLEDFRLSYDINRSQWHPLPFHTLSIYGYASNLGLLWKRNKDGIDPYYPDGMRPGKSFALGLSVIL